MKKRLISQLKRPTGKWLAAAAIGLVLFWFLSGPVLAQESLASVGKAVGNGLLNSIGSLVLVILNTILAVLGRALAALMVVVAQIVDWVISRTFNTGSGGAGLFIDAPFVETGWVILRDLANMFFIFILLIIAIATILNIRGYEAKALLPRLIGVALLINFSRVIAGVIIDVSQAVMLYFTQFGVISQGKQTGLTLALARGVNLGDLVTFPFSLSQTTGTFGKIVNSGALGLITPIIAQGLASIKDFFTTTNVFNQQVILLVANLFGVVFIFIVMVVFAWLAVMLIYRIVMLWHLLILAPIAWLSAVLPVSRQMWVYWWKNFLKWNFFGIAVGFYLFVSVLLLQAFNTSDWAQRYRPGPILSEVGGQLGVGGGQAVQGTFSRFLSSGSSLLVYATILTFLLTALGVARSQSAFGANLIVDKLPKWALGRAKGMAMAPVRLTGQGAARFGGRQLQRLAGAGVGRFRVGNIPYLGGAIRATSGRMSEYGRKQRTRADENLIKYHSGRAQPDVIADAKRGDRAAMVVAAKKGWVGSKALFSDEEAKNIYDTLDRSGYTAEAEKIADKRPEVAGIQTPTVEFGFGAGYASARTLKPGESVDLYWEVHNATQIDIFVSGMAKEAGEDDDRNVAPIDHKTITHPGGLGNKENRNGWFKLVAKSGGGSEAKRVTLTYTP